VLISVSAMKRFHRTPVEQKDKKVSIGTVTSSNELCPKTIKQQELLREEDSP